MPVYFEIADHTWQTRISGARKDEPASSVIRHLLAGIVHSPDSLLLSAWHIGDDIAVRQ